MNNHLKIKMLIEDGVKYEDIRNEYGFSLGIISNVNKIKEDIKPITINSAIIWAAGWGSRLMPITKDTPKPLVKINGVPIIESIILSLKRSGIKKITIVLGRQKEKFSYLAEKFSVDFVENKTWEKHNNISSYYFAKELMDDNVYLIDGDLFIDENFTFETHAYNSFAYTSHALKSYDIIFKKHGSFIDSISMPNNREANIDGDEYKGVFFLKRADSNQLLNRVAKYYDPNSEYDSRYWFDMLFNESGIKMETWQIPPGSIHEIDNIDDLIVVDKSYSNWEDIYGKN